MKLFHVKIWQRHKINFKKNNDNDKNLKKLDLSLLQAKT